MQQRRYSALLQFIKNPLRLSAADAIFWTMIKTTIKHGL
ncbi:hypothetical protein CHCC14820_0168 [Bacillus paralicheniformis]|uniref:Uncharacterized protein n=1 Tax=Bacillus paralicheniformis TaxID=1648923 RepID=A0A6I7TZ77_9BACI|nr:hypothetical protein SC10_B2orf04932 [Bacillus paralicheniformis]ETB72187.1 hypothetical protein A943_05915 [Bacillus sp. CPSM8]KUL12325.1 hypothetical protein LI7559_09575 [Bacillus licheniformis LMG 7559]KUL18926.1 hypothetical protein LI6934_03760 [Bacillus licheniformis LMG 6934]OLF96788.1 hypothetical protein B4121_0999 [Bacillus paralicheniformis]